MNDEAEQRIENLESELHELQHIVEQFPSAAEMERYARGLEERFENHKGYCNNRIFDLEQNLDKVDPKYLAMGDQLSQSNKNMIELQLQRHETLVRTINNLQLENLSLMKQVKDLVSRLDKLVYSTIKEK